MAVKGIQLNVVTLQLDQILSHTALACNISYKDFYGVN